MFTEGVIYAYIFVIDEVLEIYQIEILNKKPVETQIRLGICQKIYTTQFSAERILHTENTWIETIFASNKQQKCIIISNLALFWLKLNKMCKFFYSYEESLHLDMC